ncbi:chalcone isomerase family protein [Flocculibacter collagenilyticus]|uniref:chalcone isomerase family protein n=1 Tax=Flocculibacter collagenilyticus TaxID=2744479 RepID=UPI0018F76CF2|nr:chalcone isomerase family protein [Flocculibacter collagenilyticus]
MATCANSMTFCQSASRISIVIVVWVAAFFTHSVTLASPDTSQANDSAKEHVVAWKQIGQARLSVWFWDVYDATLYASSGKYQGLQPPLKLSLSYLRDISAEEFNEATKDEWKKLSLWRNESSQWLSNVNFPDVKEGDELTFQWGEDETAQLFFNGKRHASLPASEINKHFLAIWLSSNSSYPKFTRKLTHSQ